MLVEVYTPSGNWSSYPPHKHDIHIEDETGELIEADLEEVYFYHIDRPEGFAYQRVYTDEKFADARRGQSDRRAGTGRPQRGGAGAGGLPSCGQYARLHDILFECAGGQRTESGQPGGSKLHVGEGEIHRDG